MKNNSEEERSVIITGQTNRYQIKKLTKTQPSGKPTRVCIQKLILGDFYFSAENQKEILLKMYNKFELNQDIEFICAEEELAYDTMIKHIEAKINSYKQQDKLKEILDNINVIKINTIIKHILQCNMKCFYCHHDVMILYKQTRDLKQWTIDRIDNDLGHTKDNFVVACLDCNLKRRCQNINKFNYTKNLLLIKKN